MTTNDNIDHYENFPVERLFIPKQLRPAVTAIYRFARYADDLADEGEMNQNQRLAQLQQLDDDLTALLPGTELVITLSSHLRQHNIPNEHCRDLLVAFSQDVTKDTYQNEAERFRYCRYSANPIGRMMLDLFGQDSEAAVACADKLCTALQLLNFMQDIVSDYQDRSRIYLLQGDLAEFKITMEELLAPANAHFRKAIIERELARISELLRESIPILRHTRGRLRWQLLVIIAMAKTVQRRLRQRQSNWQHQARLTKAGDGFWVVGYGLQTLWQTLWQSICK